VLSDPVRIGDWEHLNRYPLTALATPYVTGLMLGRPITLEQPVYLPGNHRQGMWASPLLETVFGPELKRNREAPSGQARGLSVQGDLELAVFAVGELRRSYSELPVRWICDLALHARVQRALTTLVGKPPIRASPPHPRPKLIGKTAQKVVTANYSRPY
jgi:hypothetical protein